MNLIPPDELGEVTLLSVLDDAAKVDGPVRLFASRQEGGESGLFRQRHRRAVELLDQLLGTLLEEIPRAGNQPRRAILTAEGVRFLMRHQKKDDRAALVRGASALYRDRLIRAWKEVASPSEQELIQTCVKELYGDLLDQGDARAFERTRAKELVLSWTRAEEPEVRDGLARAMTSLGLQQIGAAGDHVSFSGRFHISDESLFPGDPVEIVAPGWAVPGPSGDTILQKALVQPLP